jgi:hypothetical protein
VFIYQYNLNKSFIVIILVYTILIRSILFLESLNNILLPSRSKFERAAREIKRNFNSCT